MVYGLFSDGFRAGGRNVTRPGTVLPADYDQDFLDNYEIGFKSRWMDDRLVFNLTAFYMEWKDYQVEVTDPGPLFATLVTNVGDAEIEGITAEFSVYLWESLDFGFNLQLLDPKTASDNELLEIAEGSRLPFSPEEKGVTWVEYTFPQEFAGGNFYGRFQFSYNGNTLNGVGDDATLQPAYQISDFKVGLEAEDWEVYAYVDNIFNERAILFDQAQRTARDDHGQYAADLGPRVFEELGRQLKATRPARPASERVRVARMRKRGHYDRATIDSILDAGIVCHVGFVHERVARRHPDALLARGLTTSTCTVLP